jgi:uncharacterized protein (TIGR02186 family)
VIIHIVATRRLSLAVSLVFVAYSVRGARHDVLACTIASALGPGEPAATVTQRPHRSIAAGQLTARILRYGALLLVAGFVWLQIADVAEAQRRGRRQPPTIEATPLGRYPPPLPALPEFQPPESIQADVSTRSVAVTSSFTGTEIVIFGAVDNSRQQSAEAGLYDIVIVLEGAPTRTTVRRKSKVAGIWINTSSAVFQNVPSYYAIATTRPLEEIADKRLLEENEIGFSQIRMTPAPGNAEFVPGDLTQYREGMIRIKMRDGLYVQADYDVAFIGRSLFRGSIDLPANVPVGPLVARVYLFREGKLLAKNVSKVKLEREGVERVLHDFAFQHSFYYGLATVLLAAAAGLVASRLFGRPAR